MRKLSSRQKQVAMSLAIGRTNQEIADELQISIKTVDSHRGQALRRLGLRNNVELTHYALRRGWIGIQLDHVQPERAQDEAAEDETARP